MKILHLTASTFFGGPERQMLGLAKHLPEGVFAHFASFSEGNRCQAFLETVNDSGFDATQLAYDSPRLFTAINEVADLIRSTKTDILLTHTYKPNLLGRLAAKKAGIPHIVVSRGWTGENFKVKAYERIDQFHLKYADHVVAVSEGQAAKVRKHRVKKLSVIRNAARLDAFQSPDARAKELLFEMLPTAKKIVVAAGRLSPEKGFDVLIDAACQTNDELGFIVFGDGPLREQLQNQISESGLQDRFKLAGFTKELDRFLPWATMLAIPSRTEGLPNVALEAASAKLPIIATQVGGNSEIVRDGLNGFLVRSEDSGDLARRMNQLADDEIQRTQLGEAGRSLVEKEFSFTAQAEKYLALSEQLILQKNGRRSFMPASGITKTLKTKTTTKISFVIDELSRAGTETQLLALIKSLNLQKADIETELILLNGESEPSQQLEPSDCAVHRLGVTKLFSLKATRQADYLRRHWHHDRPDLVVAYFMDSAYFALPIAKSLSIKTVRVRNNLGYWLTKKHQLLGQAARRMTDAVLTNSEQGKQAIIDSEGYRPEQVHVIENGIDLERFADLKRDKNGHAANALIRIGCVANLRPVKNMDGMIRAFSILADDVQNLELHIAGEGPQRASLEELIARLKLADRVKLLGSVCDVPSFLATCQITVLPSHSEGMSNALLEFMAAGTAIIATDVGANRKVLGEAGLIIPANDDVALSQALKTLLNANARQYYAALASQRVAEEYSRNKMVAKFMDFVADVTKTITQNDGIDCEAKQGKPGSHGTPKVNLLRRKLLPAIS